MGTPKGTPNFEKPSSLNPIYSLDNPYITVYNPLLENRHLGIVFLVSLPTTSKKTVVQDLVPAERLKALKDLKRFVWFWGFRVSGAIYWGYI